VRFALTSDQVALRDAVRAPLAAGDWVALTEMGLFGAMTDLGLTETDLVPVLEEVGYAAVALPVTATAFVAPPLLGHAPDGRVAVAGPGGITPFGAQAALILHLSGGVARSGTPSGPAATVDTSLDAVRSVPGDVLTDDPALVAAAVARVALGHAAELVGLGRRMVELTVGYVKRRHQFGVPVGSFQAVKHRLADAHLGLEFARPAVLAAAVDPAHVDGAVVLAAEAAHAASRAAIQCHGAIGYTVEYELHRYAKRAWALAALADPGGRLTALAAAIGLPKEDA